MPAPHQDEVRSNLAALRAQRGFGAADLAAQIGISRQTIYAIESGAYVPNTAVSLRLARVLGTTVEELFHLHPVSAPPASLLDVTVLADAGTLKPAQPLRLVSVGDRCVAVLPEENASGLAPVDAVLVDIATRGPLHCTGSARILGDHWKKPSRMLLAGCDPSVSYLVQAMHAQGCDLVVTYENSSRALQLLEAGLVHLAGTHITHDAPGKAALGAISARFPRASLAIFSYAEWEEGLVVAAGNPCGMRGIADLARHRIRFINREAGSGCRLLLDGQLRAAAIDPARVNGYKRIAAGHLQAARLVRSGDVDCCISTAAVARALSLDFIPLARKPYLLVGRRRQLEHPGIQQLLQTLQRTAFRNEVEACTGYSMADAGTRLL